MTLLVTGSIGIDTVKTPFGVRNDCLGGSVVYFSMAAGFFTPVRFVGVVGDDCPFDLVEVFKGRDVDLAGLEVRKGSKTFRWAGTYHEDINERTTDNVELNVLAEAPPKIPSAFADSEYVFLANTHPGLQMELLGQLSGPKLVVADTMNLWIENENEALKKLLGKIDGLVLNDSEAKMFTGKQNLLTAAKEIITMGPKFVVVKKGEHGTLLATRKGECFVLPAYPTEEVKDPTGTGDSFAGGMMGYLAGKAAAVDDLESLKQSLAYGTAVASLVIEDFSLDRWQKAGKDEIERRLGQLCNMMRF
jgi:sugar/nucleoside kinase (ribokinase family)